VVVGLALDVCVKATALDAAEDFETSVVVDATAPVELQPGDGQRAVEELESSGIGVV
jgi:nicotinamidase/pyrazinamidase